MNKTQITLLILAVAGIVGMSFYIKGLTTEETFASAQKKQKFVVVKVKLDKSAPIEYDAVKNPNLTTFYAFDHEGRRSKVLYSNAKPTDMERSDGLNLNGFMRDGYFQCKNIQMKCPSKYKDDLKESQKNLPTAENTDTK
ncbi:MAG: cytochrome c maturation protein CcmE [Flavisolibacter sp.]